MNDLNHLRDKQIHLKLASLDKPLACTVKNAEPSGLWVAGSPILEAVAHTGAPAWVSPAAARAPMKDPVIFVPFGNVQWFVMAGE